MWLYVGACVLLPLVCLNLAVAFFGESVVSPFSPFFLRDKARALWLYAQHRPRCVWRGHPELAPLIASAEARHHLPRHLLAALIDVESEGRPHRISFAGAMGPGQMIPSTARLMQVRDPFDSEESIEASARYLAQQLRRWRSPTLALAAYNAGPDAVHGTVPRNGQTEFYVAKVLRIYLTRRASSASRSLPGSRANR